MRNSLYRAALAIVFVIITYLSLTPRSPRTVGIDLSYWGKFEHLDKLEHFSAFLLLSFLVGRAFPARPFIGHKLAILFLYGILIELAQIYIPGRVFNIWDITANLAGCMGYLIVVMHMTEKSDA